MSNDPNRSTLQSGDNGDSLCIYIFYLSIFLVNQNFDWLIFVIIGAILLYSLTRKKNRSSKKSC